MLLYNEDILDILDQAWLQNKPMFVFKNSAFPEVHKYLNTKCNGLFAYDQDPVDVMAELASYLPGGLDSSH